MVWQCTCITIDTYLEWSQVLFLICKSIWVLFHLQIAGWNKKVFLRVNIYQYLYISTVYSIYIYLYIKHLFILFTLELLIKEQLVDKDDLNINVHYWGSSYSVQVMKSIQCFEGLDSKGNFPIYDKQKEYISKLFRVFFFQIMSQQVIYACISWIFNKVLGS